MSSAIAIAPQQQALSTDVRPGRLSREQIELLKDTIAMGATDGELQLFIQVCDRVGLDPFSKQIYLVKRWNAEAGREVAAHQVSIDGFRLIAQRTGEYEGQAAIEWCGPDGKWTDVWLLATPPVAARARVFRRGFKESVSAVARFEAYAQRKKDGGLTNMWRKMGEVMIGKCAEALALRKAFPAELSGIYTNDEMAQADTAEVVTASPQASEPAKTAVDKTKEQVKRKSGAGKLGAVLKRIDEATTLEELNAVADDARKLKGDELISAREAFAKRKATIEFADEPPHDENGEVTEGGDDEQPDEETEAGSRG